MLASSLATIGQGLASPGGKSSSSSSSSSSSGGGGGGGGGWLGGDMGRLDLPRSNTTGHVAGGQEWASAGGGTTGKTWPLASGSSGGGGPTGKWDKPRTPGKGASWDY